MAEEQFPQLSKLMGELVAHQFGFAVLPKADRQFVIQETKTAVALMVTAIKSRTNGASKTDRTYRILRPVAPKPALVSPFKVDDTFFSKLSGVKMVEHGSNFKSWFAGKVEEKAPEGMLMPFTLTNDASDHQIITDLGGEAAAEVILAEIWRLMERQANGGEGALLNDGWANIFYVRDVNRVLRAVVVRWFGDGWVARANALDGGRWSVDDRVFSRIELYS